MNSLIKTYYKTFFYQLVPQVVGGCGAARGGAAARRRAGIHDEVANRAVTATRRRTR